MLEASNLGLGQRIGGITAALRPGEVIAICGPNGAGKSTLLTCLAGLSQFETGMVTLDGDALSALSPQVRARAIGFLPQSPEIAWDVSVETLVGLGRIAWPGAPGCEAITRALAAMDLADLRCRPVSQLSGGERARALMARMLAGEPRWLMADEPLANLDLGHASALIAQLRAQAAQGAGVVLVLHDLAQAMNHADRVLVLHHGKLVADGPPEKALSEQIIAQCWQVAARWLGEKGAHALAITI